MRSTNGDADYAGDVEATTVVRDLLPLVVDPMTGPSASWTKGRRSGTIDRAAVLAAMVEDDA